MDLPVEIWYCFRDNSNTFYRFRLFVDENGFQNEETRFTEKKTTIKIVDLYNKLTNAKFRKNGLTVKQ